MNVRDGWAQASIRVWRESGLASAIPDSLVGLGEYNSRRTVFVLPVATDSPDPDLPELLSAAERLIGKHLGLLRDLASSSCSIDLFIGWSPRAPQESVTFSSRLMSMLGELAAEITIDTYGE
jgi:hypothetical protein